MEQDKFLEELMRLIAEEPEDVSLEEMACEGFIRLFYEPEHSQKVIIEFERKYGIRSADICNESILVHYLVPDEDLAEWKWAIEQFIRAGGNIWELSAPEQEDDWITELYEKTSYHGKRRNDIEGETTTSPLLFSSSCLTAILSA